MTPEDALEAAASAILAGARVDWETLQLSTPRDLAGTINELRILEAIGHLHLNTHVSDGRRDVSDDFTAPFSWGALDVVECVGRGAFGTVYRAWDRRLERHVALKLLRSDGHARDFHPRQAVAEGRLLAKVRHPNVAAVYGADRIGSSTGIWMEFIEGETLAAIIARQGPLTPDAVATIGTALCSAMAAVHEAGLLHQDIKAQNVMRDRTGRLVLTDFGAGTDQLSPWRSVGQAGTPLYVAPELFEGQTPSVRSDIYSLGVLLYEAATGDYPVNASTVAELRAAHASRRFTSLQRRLPGFPAGLAGVIDRAIQPAPGERFRSAAEMLNALQHEGAVLASSGWRGTMALLVGLAIVTLALLFAAASTSETPNRLATTVPIARQITLPSRTAVGAPARTSGVIPFVAVDGSIHLLHPASGKTSTVVAPPAEGTAWPQDVVVAPDGRFVAFVVCDAATCELRVAGGEAATRVVTRFAPGEDVDLEEWTLGGAVFTRIWAAKGHMSLGLIDLGRGTLRPLRQFEAAKPLGTSLSADSRFIAFDLPVAGSKTRDIHVLDLLTGAEHTVVSHPADDAQPLWTPDGKALFFLSDRSGVLEGWLVRMTPGGAQTAGSGAERVLETYLRAAPWIGFGPQGQLYHWRQAGAYDIRVARLGSPEEPATVASRYSGSNRGPAWSPDGRHLAYISMRYGGFELEPGSRVITILDTESGTERVLQPDLAIIPAPPIRFSPDGGSILCYCVSPRKEHGTFVVSATTGHARLVVPGAPTGWRAWSPDGRSIVAFDRSRGLVAYDVESGEARVIWRREEIPTVMLNNFGFSPDGKWLAFSGWLRPALTPGRRVAALGIYRPDEGYRLILTDENIRSDFQDWSPNGAEVIVARARPGAPQHEIWAVPVDGSTPRFLGIRNDGNAAINAADLSPDGQKLAMSSGTWLVNLWVYENFLSGRRQ